MIAAPSAHTSDLLEDGEVLADVQRQYIKRTTGKC